MNRKLALRFCFAENINDILGESFYTISICVLLVFICYWPNLKKIGMIVALKAYWVEHIGMMNRI